MKYYQSHCIYCFSSAVLFLSQTIPTLFSFQDAYYLQQSDIFPRSKHNQFLFRALSFAVTTDYHTQNFLANIQYVKIFNVIKVCKWLVYVVCDRLIDDSKIIIFDN